MSITSITNNPEGISIAMLKRILAFIPDTDIHGVAINVYIRSADSVLPAISVSVSETMLVDPTGNFCKQLTLSTDYMYKER